MRKDQDKEQAAIDAKDDASEGVDHLWAVLQDHCGKDLQTERDAVLDAIDALLSAAGVDA